MREGCSVLLMAVPLQKVDVILGVEATHVMVRGSIRSVHLGMGRGIANASS